MASGDVVLEIQGSPNPTAADSALPTTVSGGSTPAEDILVWSFGASTNHHLDLIVSLHDYGGGGINLHLVWSAASGTTGTCRLQAAFRRMEDDAVQLSASHSYDYNQVDAAAPSALTEVSYDTISFTDGADMDSLANGETGILRIRRDTTVGGGMSGDALLWSIVGIEA